MQIRLGYSRSIIYRPPDHLVDGLIKLLSYKNTSIEYQLYRHRSNRMKIIRGYLHTVAMNEADANKMWRDELERLESLTNVSLLKPTSDGMIVFPTGLLNRIVEYFVKAGISKEEIYKDCIVDTREKPPGTQGFAIHGKPAQLRPYQEEAVQKLIEAGQGTFVGCTGCGKTLVIQEVIRRLGLKVLVIVPSVSILKQTAKRFEQYFGRGKIGQFGGGKKLGKLKNITVACAPSVAKSDPELWEGIDLLMFDESHHLSAATFETICYKVVPRAFYRMSFSATFFRTDGADLAIEGAGFPPVFQYSLDDGIKEGFLARPKFIMYRVGFNSGRNYTGNLPVFAYKNHVLRNDALTQKIAKQINLVVSGGKQTLVLVREKEHGYKLARLVPGSVFVRDSDADEAGKYGCPIVDANVAVADFNDKKIQCLIGTTIISEGTDIIPVSVLFNLLCGKAKLEVVQSVGRGLRKTEGKDSLLVIDYIHLTNHMLERHSLERMKIYRKMGKVEVVELNV